MYSRVLPSMAGPFVFISWGGARDGPHPRKWGCGVIGMTRYLEVKVLYRPGRGNC